MFFVNRWRNAVHAQAQTSDPEYAPVILFILYTSISSKMINWSIRSQVAATPVRSRWVYTVIFSMYILPEHSYILINRNRLFNFSSHALTARPGLCRLSALCLISNQMVIDIDYRSAVDCVPQHTFQRHSSLCL